MRLFLMIIGYALLTGFCGAQTSAVNYRSGEPTTLANSPLSGDIELRDSTGKVSRLSDLRGTPVILNFWATWCPPCRRELPWLAEIQKKYGSRGLRVIGVSMDEANNPEVAKVAAQFGINYQLLFGTLESSLPYLGAQGLPVTMYIGRDGKLQHKFLGIADKQELDKNAQDLLR